MNMRVQHVTHRTAILGQWLGQKGLSTRNNPYGVRAESLQVLPLPVQRTQLLVAMVIKQKVCRDSEGALTSWKHYTTAQSSRLPWQGLTVNQQAKRMTAMELLAVSDHTQRTAIERALGTRYSTTLTSCRQSSTDCCTTIAVRRRVLQDATGAVQMVGGGQAHVRW